MASKLEQLQGMTQEDLIARLMKAEGQAGQRVNKLTLKVGAKGGVSVYGMGRFPMTAYASQWERIVELVKSGELEKFITANAAILARKGDAEVAAE